MDDNATEKQSQLSFQNESRYIDPECFNDDTEESQLVEKLCGELNPYFSINSLPTVPYLRKTCLPLIYEALIQVDKVRPDDPVEFFVAYILEKNKATVTPNEL